MHARQILTYIVFLVINKGGVVDSTEVQDALGHDSGGVKGDRVMEAAMKRPLCTFRRSDTGAEQY